ncbi:hypothetical protein SISNIDRAFT_461360 [Sistotremastrum niveocremeum HHB9708]|uniref:Uncharacterized protein n=1 Tax=Sistotremastrum niveocremeum HHB9708 TaxID=1314777 RepID=A0A164MPA4_9AGAM|nr:hypothetical protein SISNIDRAFT_461360 [Sistotremastrum niveocremeum HHB9708]
MPEPKVVLLQFLSETSIAASFSMSTHFVSGIPVPSCSVPPSLWNALIGFPARIRLPECEFWPPQIAYNPALARNTLFLHPPPSPPTCLWQGSLSFGQNPRRLQIQAPRLRDEIYFGSGYSVPGYWLPVARCLCIAGLRSRPL